MLPLFYAVGTSGHFSNDGAKVQQKNEIRKYFCENLAEIDINSP